MNNNSILNMNATDTNKIVSFLFVEPEYDENQKKEKGLVS